MEGAEVGSDLEEFVEFISKISGRRQTSRYFPEL
jgi:hypothetical protein